MLECLVEFLAEARPVKGAGREEPDRARKQGGHDNAPDYLQRKTKLRRTAAIALVVHDVFRLNRCAEHGSCKKHTRERQSR